MHHLFAKLRRVFAGSFLADVGKLSFGTLSGRLISIAVLPLLTRIYSPTDFAILATYMAVLGTIAVAACLRMDVAIPMAETDLDAVNLLVLALSALALITLVTLLLVITIPGALAEWLGNAAIKPYLWLVPLGIGLTGTYSAFQFWTTRARRFGHIARTRVSQSLLGAVTMLSLGWWGLAPFGLLLGNAFSTGVGGVGLAVGAARKERALLGLVSPANMISTFRRYHRYPLFSTPDAFLNIAGAQVPVLIIAATAGAEAGFLLLATQLMAAPMGLLGSSISQVYVSRAPEAYRDGRLKELTFKIMRHLALIGVGPLILVGLLAPSLMPYVFGAEWQRAGEIILWMTPWILLQFIASPVSMVMFVTGHQRGMLMLTAFGFAIRSGAVLAASRLGYPLVETFALASALFYGVCALVFSQVAHCNAKGGTTPCHK